MGLLEKNVALAAENAALRAEIARLRGLKGRPELRPSGMEPASEAKPKGGKAGRRRGRGAKRTAITEERTISVAAPPGSRFKGYETTVVQDLVVRPATIRYRRQRWLTPSGETIVAPLPPGIRGHVGPALARYVLGLYHQGRMTVPALQAHLGVLGVELSKRQLIRLLIDGREAFVDEARDVLRAGLETAAWISVDDVAKRTLCVNGARHRGANATCTQIGNADFTRFATTASRSRLNFLDLLRGGHEDYVVNDAALAVMRSRGLAAPALARLAGHPDKRFADAAAWTAHLRRLGIDAARGSPGAVRSASEGALWGSVAAHGFLEDAVILSDDAGQFNVGLHALCWVHAERLIHCTTWTRSVKLDTFTDRRRRAVARIRARVWKLYADLEAYRRRPTERRKEVLTRRFDAIFTARTGFATLDRLLRRLHADKAELLVVLERPEVPLHTNGSENDIRCQVMRRKVSAGTRSEAGRASRDAFLALMKTCRKLGVSVWTCRGDRLGVPDTPHVPPLAHLIRARASPASPA